MKNENKEIFIPGPSGRIQAKYFKNSNQGAPVALVLQPHPQYGGTMNNIVQVTVYVRDIDAFNSISDIRESYFPNDGPASAIVEVSALAWPEFLIEIAAVATI